MLRKTIMTCGLVIALAAPVVLQCVPDTSDSEVNPAAILLPLVIAANRPCSSAAVTPAIGEVLTFTQDSPFSVVSPPAGATTVKITNGLNNRSAPLSASFRAAQCIRAGDFTTVSHLTFETITIPAANQPQLNMFISDRDVTSYTVTVEFN